MPQSPFASPESAQRWQFGIQGMLIFTLSFGLWFNPCFGLP